MAQYRATLTKPFYFGVTEVTQRQFRELMPEHVSHFQGELLPADSVSWLKAVEYCQRMSALPEERAAGRVYRLPTEAEWEFAARAGSGQRYFFGDNPERLDDFAWFGTNAAWNTHEVGIKLPSPWGLYDIYGNVREWCSDWAADYPSEGVIDPRGPDTGMERIYRGGDFGTPLLWISSDSRENIQPETAPRVLGLRVVCEVAPPETTEDGDEPPWQDRIRDSIVEQPLIQKAKGSRMENQFDR
jgi:formylglycine-generating enzyme required for sulfatase activity